jgi:hypothetical protein
MKRVYDLVTNTTKFVNDRQHLSESEVVIYEEFKSNIIQGGSYGVSRAEILDKIALNGVKTWGREETQLTVDKFGELNQNYFHADQIRISDNDRDVLCDSYSTQSEILQHIQSSPYDLINYMSQVFSQMSSIEYTNLMEITNLWKEFVFFTLQPVFIAVLGIKTYITHEHYLLSGGNLVQLFESAIHKITQPYLYKHFLNLPFISNLISIPVKSLLAISAVVMVPVLYLCFTTAYPSALPMIEDDKTNSTNKIVGSVPKINKPTLGIPKEMHTWIHNIGGELGALIAEFTSGIGLGYLGTAQENVVNSIENSDTELVIDKDAKACSIVKKEG